MNNNNKNESKAVGYIVVNKKGEPTSNIYSQVGPAKAYITTVCGKSGKSYSIYEVVLGDLVITGEEHLDKNRIKELKTEIRNAEFWLNKYRDEGKFDGAAKFEKELKILFDELDELMLKYSK
jgi:hypothetical protein